MSRQPSLFISHGAPLFALDPGMAGAALSSMGREHPRPKAVLVVSPHWASARLRVGAHATPATIHDFGGFPAPLYALQYPAPGNPALAARVQTLLAQAGLEAALDPTRGLDHGAWVPLMHLFPEADVPVVPLSMDPREGPAYYLALGRALRPLRDEGVMIIGSGSITHNLYEFSPQAAVPQGYVRAFTDWFAERLEAQDTAALLDYRTRAPAAERAHPTDEHLLPLMLAAGAASEHGTVTRIAADDVRYGMLAMDIYAFS